MGHVHGQAMTILTFDMHFMAIGKSEYINIFSENILLLNNLENCYDFHPVNYSHVGVHMSSSIVIRDVAITDKIRGVCDLNFLWSCLDQQFIQFNLIATDSDHIQVQLFFGLKDIGIASVIALLMDWPMRIHRNTRWRYKLT